MFTLLFSELASHRHFKASSLFGIPQRCSSLGVHHYSKPQRQSCFPSTVLTYFLDYLESRNGTTKGSTQTPLISALRPTRRSAQLSRGCAILFPNTRVPRCTSTPFAPLRIRQLELSHGSQAAQEQVAFLVKRARCFTIGTSGTPIAPEDERPHRSLIKNSAVVRSNPK